MTEPKLYRYYGLQYTWSVGAMAKLANVSLRTMKDGLKLHSIGYDEKIAEGWSAAQCFAHAGQERKRRATPKWAIWMKLCARSSDCVCLLLDIGVIPMGKLQWHKGVMV